MKKEVETTLVTKYGTFRVLAYNDDGKEHLAIIKGDVKNDIHVRLHSECFTGDVLSSLRCDCRTQLIDSLKFINLHDGVVVYLRQEGRGIGLINKLKAYNLQDEGLDTVEANLKLGFKADERDYKVAADILKDLGLKSIRLITNNPAKVTGLTDNGIEVSACVFTKVEPNAHNGNYLKTKKEKMGHAL